MLAVLLLLTAGMAYGENTVVVTSVAANPNDTDVQVPVLLVNDQELRGVVCPFMIRSLSGGADVTAVAIETGDRLSVPGPLSEISYLNHYDQGVSNTSGCKRFSPEQPKSPGGFVGPSSYNGTDKQAVTGHPYGIMMFNHRIFGAPLGPGADVSGSYVITVDVNGQSGVIEIDTACVDPANHLSFSGNVIGEIIEIIPEFTAGLITVGSPGDNDPPVAVDDHMGARDGVRLYVVGAGVLTNDSDPDGDPLTAILNTGTSHGALDIHADGSFFYTPDVGYDGLDQFSYYADDGSLQSPAPATVNLHVKGGGAVTPGDYDEDGDLTAIDLAQLIEALFMGGSDPTDGGCRDWPRGDIDCDGYSTGLDLGLLVDYLFAGGDSPCDPCGL
jgi:hypothetical protein